MEKRFFQTSSHGKCILAGEHSVLRGHPALVLPVSKKTITLEFEEHSSLELYVESPQKEICQQLFLRLLLRSLTLLEKNPADLCGKFVVRNQIKMGAGLGFSAALSVIITRWLIWKGWLLEGNLFSFARELENIFHGKSSGVDIAGVLSDELIHFEIDRVYQPVHVNWQPILLLSYSGLTKTTKEDIQQVYRLIKNHPEASVLIDEKMQQSVLNIEHSLLQNETQLPKLATAIHAARQCFQEWQLIPPQLQKHIDKLHHLGALAAKPTGGGGGGYVLSLWENMPTKPIDTEFIPIVWK